jgi:hypothetical protein
MILATSHPNLLHAAEAAMDEAAMSRIMGRDCGGRD